ncbi:hypothetical protein HOF92_16675 [bacterium]|jgi:protein-arginine deiminase|nr:hypothetical protein [bacterium]
MKKTFALLTPILLHFCLMTTPSVAERSTDRTSTDLQEVQQGQIGKIRILSNNNIPRKVVVVLSSSTESFVHSLVKTVAGINSKSEKLDLTVHAICSSRSKAQRFLQKMQEQGYGDIVEVNERFHTSDQWMQDWGEIAVAEIDGKEKPQMLIIDSNRGRGLAGLPKILADLWNAYYIKNPRRGVKGDYGGNIEVSPDNVLVQGTTSTPELRNLFNQHGYQNKRALLDTHWLLVGHVDEYMTFVPNPSAEGGYTILKSDPGLAFELIKNATEEELSATNPQYRSTVRDLHVDLNSGALEKIPNANYDLSDAVDIMKAPSLERLNETDRQTRLQRLRQLIDLNRSISELIDHNIEILKDKIREVTNTPDRKIHVVSLPTIFRGRKSGEDLYRCVALMPGVVNMLILGDQLIIPDAQMPMLNHFIKTKMGQIKLTTHFLDDMAYHNLAGEIHCGTNVIREHDKYWTYPDNIIHKRIFGKLFPVSKTVQ